ncbi:MAG: hypothetical protein ACI9HK_005148 [Pirellulaceae bacterium]|jgi:hypothetical protein
MVPKAVVTLRFVCSARQSVGHRIQRSGLAEASALLVDHDRTFSVTFVSQLGLLAAHVDGRFVADSLKAEGVVLFDRASFLGIEQLVGILGGVEEADTGQVDAEAVDRLHAEGRVFSCVVVVFDPLSELFVELTERGKVEVANEKLVTDSAKEPLDLSLGGSVSNGRVTEDTTNSGANEGDFLTAVDGTVIDQQSLGHSAFIEGCSDRIDHRVGVLLEKN